MKRTLAALILVNLLASCDPNTPADTAEEVSVTTSAVDTEAPTEPVTDAPTETTAEETTEEITEEVTEEAETHRPTREDWEDDDPQNPYYNLIQVGTSFDGKTPVYDGRYEFDHIICHTSDGAEFYSMQDALDWLEGYGGNIQMDADLNVCLKLDIPNDGCFYRYYGYDLVATLDQWPGLPNGEILPE